MVTQPGHRWPGLKRQRRAQLASLEPTADAGDLVQLRAAAAESSAQRWGKNQEKLATELAKQQELWLGSSIYHATAHCFVRDRAASLEPGFVNLFS